MTHDIALQLHWHKDDLAASSLGHLLKRLELTDLHGRGRREDVGRLAHEASSVDLSAGGDDLALTDALLLRGAGEGCRDLGGEDDVLDEDALDSDTPLVCDVADDLGDLERDSLAFRDDGLDRTCADDVSQGRHGSLHERQAEIPDAERGTIGVHDMEIDDRVAVK